MGIQERDDYSTSDDSSDEEEEEEEDDELEQEDYDQEYQEKRRGLLASSNARGTKATPPTSRGEFSIPMTNEQIRGQ